MLTANVVLPKLTASAFTALLPSMHAGQATVYHTGSLMFDRLRGPACQVVHGAAQAAWDAYERGEVSLVQRRLAPLVYEYIAVRTDKAIGVGAAGVGTALMARNAARVTAAVTSVL